MKSDLEMLEERDERMRNRYHDPIEQFSSKIDQLLDALNRVIYFAYFFFINFINFSLLN
jgi:hypothetical protein